MAEKEQQVYPLAPTTNGYAQSDEESLSEQSKELRRKKRMKCLMYVVIFAVFQTAIILLFALTIMKFKTPKFRVRSASFEAFTVTPPPANPSFTIRMNAELGVKNTNFGQYKFQDTTIYFFYRDMPVGAAVVANAKAKARSTKKFNIVVELNSSNLTSNSQLGTDLGTGVLQLKSQSELRGKVEVIKVFKKNKSARMDCTIDIAISPQTIQNLVCN